MTGMPIWYELMTPDPAAVASFYKAVGGWTIPDGGGRSANGSEYRMMIRPDGGALGGVLTLSEEMAAHGTKPAWVPYFHVADVDASIEALKAAGGAMHMPATDLPVGRMAMVSDPQGAPFYMMLPIPPEGDPDAKSDVFDQMRVGHVAWNELNTDDAPGQEAFYTGLLGWTISGEMPMPGDNTYHFLECEGTGIGAIGSMKPEGAPTMWQFYLRVLDIGAAQAAVEATGGKVLNGLHEVPGDDVIIIATDPAGARVGFVGKKGE
ncbi:VOC family protein [Altererythrobacter salegens]|uniref:VOC family protein n=1 Tax=Croceibacterium salegens TaxID=1737568 RepID=A0A6I4SW41_9SPHN|nr:VOC family protein [Croceibacterium salegens]MXO60235.1 VOC family protein [Croceibacterium salegens]